MKITGIKNYNFKGIKNPKQVGNFLNQGVSNIVINQGNAADLDRLIKILNFLKSVAKTFK